MTLVVVGAGGQATVVVDAVTSAGDVDVCVVDSATELQSIEGASVYRSLDQVENPTHFIIAVGDNYARAAEYQRYTRLGLAPQSVIHPTATIARSAVVGPGVFVGAGVVINSASRIGHNAIVNTASVVEHHCVVGDHAFVAPAAVMCGACTLGDFSMLGANACMIPMTSIGNRTVVGAGALVISDFADDLVVAGVPARLVKKVIE